QLRFQRPDRLPLLQTLAPRRVANQVSRPFRLPAPAAGVPPPHPPRLPPVAPQTRTGSARWHSRQPARIQCPPTPAFPWPFVLPPGFQNGLPSPCSSAGLHSPNHSPAKFLSDLRITTYLSSMLWRENVSVPQ